MKKQILLFSFIFLIIPIVLAAEIDITVDKLTDKAIAGGEAEFFLKIKNNQVRSDTFQISPDSLSVHPFSDIVYTITSADSQLEIPTNQEKGTTVTIKYKEDVKPGRNYVSYVWIKSINNQNVKVKQPISAYVISQKQIIDSQIKLPQEIIPGKKIPYEINFKNQINENFENLDIFITSPVYSEQSYISLEPYEEKSKTFNFNVASLTSQGEYTLSVRLFDGDKIKGEKLIKFKVQESSELSLEKDTKKSFLSSTLFLNYKNVGNSQIDETVTYPKISFFKKLFTKVTPKTEVIKQDNNYVYSWNFILEPGETFNIEISTSYTWLFIIGILILLALGIFYYLKTRHVTIKKKAFKITESDATTKLKVLLHIINKTTSETHQIRVIDLLPNMVKLDEEFGSLRPQHIQKGSAGVRLIWEIPLLEPGEERVISYKVKSKMHVIGKIALPSASVQYHGKNKKIINIKSNRSYFLSHMK